MTNSDKSSIFLISNFNIYKTLIFTESKVIIFFCFTDDFCKFFAFYIHFRTFTVHSHNKVLDVLKMICRMTLPEKDLAYIGKSVLFHELKDKECFHVKGMDLQCFDFLSTKEKQFGFRALMPDDTALVCLGDEPYNESNRCCYVENADWLLCEAFCL